MSLQASNLDLQLYFVELNFFKLQLHVHSTIAKTYTCAKCCEQLDPGYMKKKAFIMATTVLSQEILGSNAADSSREGFRRLGNTILQIFPSKPVLQVFYHTNPPDVLTKLLMLYK